MRFVTLIPISVRDCAGDLAGAIDVIVEYRCGFLWLNKRRVKRRAISRTGASWFWCDKPSDYVNEFDRIVNSHRKELLSGNSVEIPMKELLA